MNTITREQAEKMLKEYSVEIIDFTRGIKSHAVISEGAKRILDAIFGEEEEPEAEKGCEGCGKA